MEFKVVAEAFRKLEVTSERLELISILATLFSKADASNIHMLVYLLQGRVAAPYTGIEIGMGEKLVEEAIARAYGVDKGEVERMYKELGDLGLVAERLAGNKKQMTLFSEPLTLERVYNNFYKIATASGEGVVDKKIRLLADLLKDAEPLEARYIVRIPIGRLRLGIGDATILEALAVAKLGDRSYREDLERAYNYVSDLGYVAKLLYEKGLEGIRQVKPVLGIPIRPALAQRAASLEEIMQRMGGECAAEAKYDGFRLQIHKKGDQVWIFSRRMENMTGLFPDITKAVLEQIDANEVIFEGEAIAYNEETGEFYPFQVTIQRKRKYGIEKAAEEYPLKLFSFDIMYLEGEDLTPKPYTERRKILEGIIKKGDTIELSERIIARSVKELRDFFESCVERGLEGIMAKDLKAPYIAGARKWAWIKYKRVMKSQLSDTLDLVIVGYYKGRGQRAKLGIGGVLVAVYDPKNDVFKTVAKVGSGFTEEQFVQLKQLLDQITLPHKHPRVVAKIDADVWVEPKYVITVLADEITRSPNHTAGWDGERGLALRFPRAVSFVREDKGPEDATTEEELIQMYKQQKYVKVEEGEDSY